MHCYVLEKISVIVIRLKYRIKKVNLAMNNGFCVFSVVAELPFREKNDKKSPTCSFKWDTIICETDNLNLISITLLLH